jgi:hypothetical protein
MVRNETVLDVEDNVKENRRRNVTVVTSGRNRRHYFVAS